MVFAPLAHIHWNVAPELFSFGSITVRWYGAFFATGFVCGFLIVRWIFQREEKPQRDLDTLLIYMLAGTVIGARLGHCLIYHPEYFLSHPVEILMVWKGGLASHGGAAGILIALYLYSRRRRGQPYLWLLDRIAVPTALGGCFIRVGNLFNSEIIGLPSDLPWAILFARRDDVDLVPRHPAQLYESLAYGLIFLTLLWVYRKKKCAVPAGLLAGLFLVSVFSARFLIEFVKLRQAAYGEGLPLSLGQLLSIPLVFVGVILVLRAIRGGRAIRG
jgi:prolipoprotein diacylglyceryl transferase